MDFIPEKNENTKEVPYFDDVTSDAGWQGHSTTKSIETLKSEVSESLSRLGAIVLKTQMGTFSATNKARQGMRIDYMIEAPGKSVSGRIDIAALPVRISGGTMKTLEKRKSQSMKMALYMLRMALDGMWFLEQLSPGYAALLPWMLVDKNETFGQKWTNTMNFASLLPKNEDFVDGIVVND